MLHFAVPVLLAVIAVNSLAVLLGAAAWFSGRKRDHWP
jgi:hypothetical protein